MTCAHCKKPNQDVLCDSCSRLIDNYLKLEKRLKRLKIQFEYAEEMLWMNSLGKYK